MTSRRFEFTVTFLFWLSANCAVYTFTHSLCLKNLFTRMFYFPSPFPFPSHFVFVFVSSVAVAYLLVLDYPSSVRNTLPVPVYQ